MDFAVGDHIKSIYDHDVHGIVVGAGLVKWPEFIDEHGQLCHRGDHMMRRVYIIQVAKGSSSLGPAARVVAADCSVPYFEVEDK